MSDLDTIRMTDNGLAMFWCPGCETHHGPRVNGDEPVWGWNKSLTKPTFTPSIRVRGFINEKGDGQCHLFVRDGMIEYLGDCTHEMAGKTVPMVTWAELDSEKSESE